MRALVFCMSVLGSGLVSAAEAPWERHAFDIEEAVLWQVGKNTPIDYMLVQTQFSWRSPWVMKHDFSDGSVLVVRNHASLIGAWIADGPENRYFGLSGSPSIEWWSADAMWSLYFSIGGGVGVIDSTNVVGGQGQDFTLNWFAKTGMRWQMNEDVAVFGGPFFQHMSNGGATTPNPGIDALGVSVGASFSF